MAHHCLFGRCYLWGIYAIGDILSLGDRLSFLSVHFTTKQLPSTIHSNASVRICTIVQSCPQTRGQPSDAYCCSAFAA